MPLTGRWALGGWAALLLCAPACSGTTVTLGTIMPTPYHFDAPVLVAELASTFRADNPTLTADLLEIYFTTNRVSNNGDVWFATRPSPDVPFGAPAAVPVINGPDTFETSSAISADGLTLWFGSDRPGGVGSIDIWVSQRASRTAEWSTPIDVLALNSPADDIPRPPGQRGLVMPMASTKVVPENPNAVYQTYLAARPNAGAPFGAPQPIPLLDFTNSSTVDGFLTDDGLTLFYSSGPATPVADAGSDAAVDAAAATADGGVAKSDLYVAFRRSTTEASWETQPLTDLNTAADERDPWLTPDGKTLYFTSDRDGTLTIYTAHVRPR
jgi:hypothetical protein